MEEKGTALGFAEATTVCAIATPPGTGGIAVVRLSGPLAYAVAAQVFHPVSEKKTLSSAKGYTALFGHFIQNGRVCDEVVALCFRAPHSYTGEDVVELSCHGGSAVSEQLLRACLAAGARPAGAGEFTKRAFLNRRISLTQAEAVMDLIGASSAQGAAAAAAVMEGALYQKINAVRQNLLTLAGHLAAYTDYPEEDVPELRPDVMAEALEQDKAVLDGLIDGYAAGLVLRRGVQTAIVGSPNVGKSTLLNLLSGFERAIVTPIAGTTRDVVEQEVQLGEVRLLLADTAGLRENAADAVEAEGIRRSHQRMERAGLVLAVFDASQPISAEDEVLAEKCRGRAAVAILNKTDLPPCFDARRIEPCFVKTISISARDTSFLPTVTRAVSEALGLTHTDPDAYLLANERQLAAARDARDALADALGALRTATLDAAGICVDDALHALYALTGENAADDVIDEVFSRFCVGK